MQREKKQNGTSQFECEAFNSWLGAMSFSVVHIFLFEFYVLMCLTVPVFDK